MSPDYAACPLLPLPSIVRPRWRLITAVESPSHILSRLPFLPRFPWLLASDSPRAPVQALWCSRASDTAQLQLQRFMRFRTARLARAGRHGEAGCFPTQTHSHPPDCSAHRLTDTSYQPRTPDSPCSLRLPAARYSSLPRTLRPVRARLAVRMRVVPAERRCTSTVDVRANACWVSRSGEQLVQRG